jgi:hypothetical protein
MVIATVCDVDGARLTRENARNCLGGSPADFGILTYACTTSDPVRTPVLETVTWTAMPEGLLAAVAWVSLKVV